MTRTPNAHPKERHTDGGWRRLLRENWYRDVWLFLITTFAVVAVVTGRNENSQRIEDIQASRAESIRLTCVQQNERHDRSIATLDAIIDARLRQAPQERGRLEASRATTRTLIRALVPKEDCDARVSRLVQPVT